ncbi:MAG: hypothetical protein WAX38_02100 [Minisyncoccia bacterium]
MSHPTGGGSSSGLGTFGAIAGIAACALIVGFIIYDAGRQSNNGGGLATTSAEAAPQRSRSQQKRVCLIHDPGYVDNCRKWRYYH